MCSPQESSEKVAGKEAEILEREFSRRMLEECIAHQRALQAEKHLVARMEEVWAPKPEYREGPPPAHCATYCIGRAQVRARRYAARLLVTSPVTPRGNLP